MSEQEAYRLQELDQQEAAKLEQLIASDEKLAMDLCIKFNQQEVSLNMPVVVRNVDVIPL